MVHLFEPVFSVHDDRITKGKGAQKRKSNNIHSQTTTTTTTTEEDDEQDIDNASLSSESADSDDDEPVAPPDFPHAPYRQSHDIGPVPKAPLSRRNQKRKHMTIMSSILYKCVHDGDFARASRAFAILLRFEFQGQRLNLRHNDLWSLGADILLRRAMDTDTVNQESSPLDLDPVDKIMASEKGFADAKSFYERLILQYPDSKQSKSATAVQFYPAFLGMWILHVQAKIRIDTARTRHQSESLNSNNQTGGNSFTPQDQAMDVDEQTPNRISHFDAAVVDRYLPDVGDISDRIDELIQQPPYDTDPAMLRLRGRMWLWQASLRQTIVPDSPDIRHWHESARRILARADTEETKRSKGSNIP